MEAVPADARDAVCQENVIKQNSKKTGFSRFFVDIEGEFVYNKEDVYCMEEK